MCGLVGIIDFSRKKEDYNKEISKMLSVINHRGPDNSKIGSHKNFYYGFNRLSIIDLSENANQPFENNMTITMANCEIYNYLKLKESFKMDYKKFNSNSDAEVIPFLYDKFDIDFLKHLDGMFAISIYDKNKDILYLARDRLGIKPIYYYYDDNYFAFASEVKALLQLSFVNKNINLEVLNKYLISGFGESENSFISKIKIIPAGKFIEINKKKITKSNYYQRPKKFINFKSENEILESFDNLLNESIKSHLISDVPTSLMLSYGKDSNILRNKINEISIENFKTFTLGFNDFKKNEIFMNNNKGHENFIVNFNLFKNLEESFITAMDQPTVDGLNTYILTKLISEKGYRVVLSGLGADELLGGYKLFSFLPNIYTSKLRFNLITKISYLLSYFATYQKSQKLKKIYNAKKFENIYSVFRDYSLYEESNQIKNIFNNGILYSNDQKKEFSNGWRYSQDLEIINYLQNRLLPDSDVFSMSNSVELRVPFLSNKIIDFSLSINFEKFKNLGHSKRILDKLYSKNLNKEIFSRKKQGFALPMNDWLKDKYFENKILECFANHSLLKLDKNFKNILFSTWKLFLSNKIDYEIVWKYYLIDKWIKTNNLNIL